MTDSFKDELQRIAQEAEERKERERIESVERERQFRKDADVAYEKADAINARVIIPILADFSSAAQGVGEFRSEFRESDSQPEFTHTSKLGKRTFRVAFLYWVAGSDMLTCGFGDSHDSTLSIKSFDEPNLDANITSWLKSELLQKYQKHLE